MIRKGVPENATRKLSSNKPEDVASNHRIGVLSLPVSMIPEDYGSILSTSQTLTPEGLIEKTYTVQNNKDVFLITTTILPKEKREFNVFLRHGDIKKIIHLSCI